MATYIQQPRGAAVFGSGLAQGLSEQLEKEMDRNRLKKGLKEFERDAPNLNTTQQYSRLLSIPGITPQAIQTFGDLAQRGNLGQAYANAAGGGGGAPQQAGAAPGTSWWTPQQQPQAGAAPQQAQQPMPQQAPPQQAQQAQMQQAPAQPLAQPAPVAPSQPAAAPEAMNPFSPQLQKRQAWTQQQKMARTSDLIQSGFLPAEAWQKAGEEEQRYLAEPLTEQERQEYTQGVENDIRKRVGERLDTLLQKKIGETGGTAQLSADIADKLSQGAIDDLRMHPEMSAAKAVDKWARKGFELNKTQVKLHELAGKSGILSIWRGKENLASLKSARQAFADANALEDFQNQMVKDFGLSATRAAGIAYPISDEMKKVVSTMPSSLYSAMPDQAKAESYARQLAENVTKEIGPDDSILSIIQEAQKKDRYFDRSSFIDQLRRDKNAPLNERQRRELSEVPDLLPTWGDFFYLGGRS